MMSPAVETGITNRRAIALGCNSISLAVIEALNHANVKVLAIAITGRPSGRYTRGAFEVRNAPGIYDNQERLLEYLLSLPQEWSDALVFPTTDAGVAFLSLYRADLLDRFVVSLPEWSGVEPLFDTRLLYSVADRCGVPVPWYLVPQDEADIHSKRSEIRFPCIIKPGVSDRFAWKYKKKVFHAGGFDELIDLYREVSGVGIPVLFSEIIPGCDDKFVKYCTYRDRDGQYPGSLCLRKLRQHPPGFGVARVSVTVPMIPAVELGTNRLLEEVGFRGACSTEYKYDHRDGRYKLIEVNVRPQLQERLLLHAGVNFPAIAYLDWVEGQSTPVKGYTEGLYWIDAYRDILNYLRWHSMDDHWPGRYFAPYWQDHVFRSPILRLRCVMQH